MRPIARSLAPAPVSPPVHRGDARAPLTQEVSVRRAEDGGQIVVRRVVAGDAGARRTLHIDAVVR